MKDGYPRERLAEIFEILAENLPCFSRIEEEISALQARDSRARRRGARGGRGGAGAPRGEPRRRSAHASEWSAAAIGGRIKELGARLSVKGKALYMPLRAAVTGSLHGPDLSRVMEIRGKESVLRAIRSALAGTETP